MLIESPIYFPYFACATEFDNCRARAPTGSGGHRRLAADGVPGTAARFRHPDAVGQAAVEQGRGARDVEGSRYGGPIRRRAQMTRSISRRGAAGRRAVARQATHRLPRSAPERPLHPTWRSSQDPRPITKHEAGVPSRDAQVVDPNVASSNCPTAFRSFSIWVSRPSHAKSLKELLVLVLSAMEQPRPELRKHRSPVPGGAHRRVRSPTNRAGR